MTTAEVIEVLGFANGNDRAVHLVLQDGGGITGVPSSVDLHPTAYEVYLCPLGDDDTEIAVSLTAIRSAELV